nr:immunoglobulin heavy chain junction region [Mus musculus]NSM03767.1 immunoglobulin heavy chain junction region [Mus musculus]NSM04188.1 immunoglobulin heavy chain junction region [Mus musculus]NSM05156.1 immunoglobulin heavy chain junction region [Mus musculus]NSM05175.1 immunoglobulin heavy chain junction region [Mus musculus]
CARRGRITTVVGENWFAYW